MTQEDKRAYNYARDRLANDDYPVYSDEYELELAYKAGIEDAKNHPNWISVEDELPEQNMWVLTYNGTSINLLMFAGNGGWYDHSVAKHRIVTHWMPLPAIEGIRGNQGKISTNRIIGTEEHIKVALDVIDKKGGEE